MAPLSNLVAARSCQILMLDSSPLRVFYGILPARRSLANKLLVDK